MRELSIQKGKTKVEEKKGKIDNQVRRSPPKSDAQYAEEKKHQQCHRSRLRSRRKKKTPQPATR